MGRESGEEARDGAPVQRLRYYSNKRARPAQHAVGDRGEVLISRCLFSPVGGIDALGVPHEASQQCRGARLA
jgi:hypothetical protein